MEAGTLDIVVENPGAEDQCIETNIDAKVYTTNSRTKVWDGVCAISSIENGEESTLLQYGYDGTVLDDLKNSVANTNAITLIWPGAASTAQTIAGVIMEFRYCQFGQMRTTTDIADTSAPKRRVIAFGAEMSPDFLVPTNFDWGGRQTSALEVVQLKMAKEQLYAGSSCGTCRTAMRQTRRPGRRPRPEAWLFMYTISFSAADLWASIPLWR
ncbi:MAG: hypothetical protein ACLR23_24210 [Clostridia bacterium]